MKIIMSIYASRYKFTFSICNDFYSLFAPDGRPLSLHNRIKERCLREEENIQNIEKLMWNIKHEVPQQKN